MYAYIDTLIYFILIYINKSHLITYAYIMCRLSKLWSLDIDPNENKSSRNSLISFWRSQLLVFRLNV